MTWTHYFILYVPTRYWWLHRGVKEHAPTIDPVMIPYRFTGGNFAAKVMRGAGQRHSWMMNEFEMMNVLHHPRLIRDARYRDGYSVCDMSFFNLATLRAG